MEIITPEIKKKALDFYKKILAIPSVNGHTEEIANVIKQDFENIGFKSYSTPYSDNLFVHLPGSSENQHILFMSHIDNVGLVVESITNDKIKFNLKGFVMLRSIPGKKVTIHSKKYDPKKDEFTKIDYKGRATTTIRSMINDKDNAESLKLNLKNFYITLHETEKIWKYGRKRKQRADTTKSFKELGIQPGDLISFQPEIEFLENGFILSRGQDNKMSIFNLYTTGLLLKHYNITPSPHISIGFNSCEECGVPLIVPDLKEFAYKDTPDISYAIAIDAIPAYDEQEMDVHLISTSETDKPTSYNSKINEHLLRICKNKGLWQKKAYLKSYASDASMKKLTGNLPYPCGIFGAVIDNIHSEEESIDEALFDSVLLTWHLITDMPFKTK